jgi:chemotaxis protein CheX
MAGMNADFINPFLMSATKIMQEICQTEMKIGKPYVKTTEFENESVAVMIGITGELKGQVIMAFEFNKALDVASKMMMGMPVTALDDMSISAISELGNMIMGNTATIFSQDKIDIDITPPTIAKGSMKFDNLAIEHILVPISVGEDRIEMHIAIKN